MTKKYTLALMCLLAGLAIHIGPPVNSIHWSPADRMASVVGTSADLPVSAALANKPFNGSNNPSSPHHWFLRRCAQTPNQGDLTIEPPAKAVRLSAPAKIRLWRAATDIHPCIASRTEPIHLRAPPSA